MTETLTMALTAPPMTMHAVRQPGFATALRAGHCAQRIAEGYLRFDSAFRTLTERAAERFAERDWQGSQQDVLDRTELYERSIERTVADIRTTYSDLMYQPAMWQAVKRNFASVIDELPDNEFCKGFFNAITQRLFKIIGVPQYLEFAPSATTTSTSGDEPFSLRTITHRACLQQTLMQLLSALPIEADWQDAQASAAQLGEAIEARLQSSNLKPDSIEWLDTVFYRFTRAYVIGRIRTNGANLPFALALTNGEAGMRIDTLLIQQSELNTVLSGARASFHVELDEVTPTTAYLQTLAPDVARSELTAMLGWPARNS